MDIIEKVIDMCEDAEVLKPQAPQYILAEVKPCGRIHAVFGEDREIHIAFTDNLRELISGKYYLGAVMLDRHDCGTAVRHFYISANAMVLTSRENEQLITTVGSNSPIDLIWNVGNHDKVPEIDRPKIDIRYNARGDGLTF